jgi:hypothetical protein
MMKTLLMISLLLCSGMVLAQINNQASNEFEAELRLLEGRDEAAMERAEKITAIVEEGVKMKETEVVEDSVSVGNAATVRPSSSVKSPKADPLVQESAVQKTRRIRSR